VYEYVESSLTQTQRLDDLVCGSAAGLALFYVHHMNRVNSHNKFII